MELANRSHPFVAMLLAAAFTISSLPTKAQETARPSPAPQEKPEVYCKGNELALPASQKQICKSFDRAQGRHTPFWNNVEADNGQLFKIDMNSVESDGATGAIATIFIDQGGLRDPLQYRQFHFDCAGHYVDSTNLYAGLIFAPPRSVAGQLASMACLGAHPGQGAVSH